MTDDVAEPIEAIPVETAAANPLTTGLAWLAVVVVVAVAGFWVWNRWIDPPVGGTISRYVNKDGGVVFENPSAEFRVTMPSAYSTSTGKNEWGDIVTVNDKLGDYEFTVTKTPQPSSALDSFTTGLDTLAGQLASDAHAEIVSQTKPTPIVDVAVKELVYRNGTTYWRARLDLLKDRLYTIIAKVPGDDPAPYKRLTDSFQILGPR
ncbi:MAG: hypothetical protein ACXVJ7_00960 [Acidimicrobiia bacterium]